MNEGYFKHCLFRAEEIPLKVEYLIIPMQRKVILAQGRNLNGMFIFACSYFYSSNYLSKFDLGFLNCNKAVAEILKPLRNIF